MKATSLLGAYFKEDMVVYFFYFIYFNYLNVPTTSLINSKGREENRLPFVNVDYLWSNAKFLFCFESDKSGFWQNLRIFVTETLLSSDSSFWLS